MPRITSLPTRYEPLVGAFGDRAKATFVSSGPDLLGFKRFLAAAESSKQGKLMFVAGTSGAGKSTFVQSLEVFLADQVGQVVRLPAEHELSLASIPAYLAALPISGRSTVVNFDGREAPSFDEPEYRTFLGALNGVLRNRRDLLILWPVTDEQFADRLVTLLGAVGGRSPFGPQAILTLSGLPRDKYLQVLEKILQVANWRLDDAAVTVQEVEELGAVSATIGEFLDRLQALIAERFDVGAYGVDFPTVAIAISSEEPKIREICRSLRRADSFYLEASRLLMYTRKSNVAEWWGTRATDLKSALPHVIALFNAQLVSISASGVVHSILQFGAPDLQHAVEDVRADSGNARRVIASSELYKFVRGEGADNREYGSSVKEATYNSFARLQGISEKRHRAINEAILQLVADAGTTMSDLQYEVELVHGLFTDATYSSGDVVVALEFHHKAKSESTSNKIAIYILEKLKEYAVNYGLAQR